MKAVNYGDVVTVVKLDRLARSSRDLQNIWHELDEVGCGFVSLGESWCDTTTDVGRLVMTIMGGIAEFERAKDRLFFTVPTTVGNFDSITARRRKYLLVVNITWSASV